MVFIVHKADRHDIAFITNDCRGALPDHDASMLAANGPCAELNKGITKLWEQAELLVDDDVIGPPPAGRLGRNVLPAGLKQADILPASTGNRFGNMPLGNHVGR